MSLSRKNAAVLIATSAVAAALAFSLRAQQQLASPLPAPPVVANTTLIVLDPAHGGPDTGAMFDNVAEKDVALALASRVRTALTSAGFTVVTTRDNDPDDLLTTDQRAETANRTHALACIVLHATAAGSGVHIYTSELPPPKPDAITTEPPVPFAPVPWDMAQSKFVTQSLGLAAALTAALGKDRLPVLSAQAPVRPLDNLMCPAIVVELAPLIGANSGSTPPTDVAYQQQFATTLVNTLRAWRDRIQPAAPSLDSQIAAQSKAIAAAEAAGRATVKARTPAPAAAVTPPKVQQ